MQCDVKCIYYIYIYIYICVCMYVCMYILHIKQMFPRTTWDDGKSCKRQALELQRLSKIPMMQHHIRVMSLFWRSASVWNVSNSFYHFDLFYISYSRLPRPRQYHIYYIINCPTINVIVQQSYVKLTIKRLKPRQRHQLFQRSSQID